MFWTYISLGQFWGFCILYPDFKSSNSFSIGIPGYGEPPETIRRSFKHEHWWNDALGTLMNLEIVSCDIQHTEASKAPYLVWKSPITRYQTPKHHSVWCTPYQTMPQWLAIWSAADPESKMISAFFNPYTQQPSSSSRESMYEHSTLKWRKKKHVQKRQANVHLLSFCNTPGLSHSWPSQSLRSSWHNPPLQEYFWLPNHDVHTETNNR